MTSESHLMHEQLLDYVMGETPDGEAEDLERHLATCPACRRDLHAMGERDDAIEEILEPQPQPWGQIAARIRDWSANLGSVIQQGVSASAEQLDVWAATVSKGLGNAIQVLKDPSADTWHVDQSFLGQKYEVAFATTGSRTGAVATRGADAQRGPDHPTLKLRGSKRQDHNGQGQPPTVRGAVRTRGSQSLPPKTKVTITLSVDRDAVHVRVTGLPPNSSPLVGLFPSSPDQLPLVKQLRNRTGDGWSASFNRAEAHDCVIAFEGIPDA